MNQGGVFSVLYGHTVNRPGTGVRTIMTPNGNGHIKRLETGIVSSVIGLGMTRIFGSNFIQPPSHFSLGFLLLLTTLPRQNINHQLHSFTGLREAE